jgi:hypothetical protein
MRWIESHLVQGGAHVAQPGVPFRLPDDEVCMPHAQPGMAAKLVIGARAAPVLHEEQAQVLLGGSQILTRVDRPEFRIGGNALVKGMHQAAKRLLAADCLVETGRFCRGVVHSWRPGYVAQGCGAPVGQQRLLSAIVTSRTQSALPSPPPLPYMQHATCTWDLRQLCTPHTRQRQVDSQNQSLAKRFSSYVELVSPGWVTGQRPRRGARDVARD